MLDAAAVVLAGGRSSRMGSPKAALGWHGSTLLRRVTGIASRAVAGPVVVVRADGQALPELGAGVEVVTDARDGRGPMQGLAAGLRAVEARAELAYVSSADVPFLHPAFIHRVLSAVRAEFDVVLPEIGGHHQPLAAAYRSSLRRVVEELVDADRLRPGFLFERCRVLRLDGAAMLSDIALARVDPSLASVSNLNEPADYERALGVPAPEIRVERRGGRAPDGVPGTELLRAWTLGDLAAAAGLALDERVLATLNGDRIRIDAELPLAAGDLVAFRETGGGKRVIPVAR